MDANGEMMGTSGSAEAALPEQPFAQLGYDVMAACFQVHNTLGGGLLEEIYQESLEWELTLRGIAFVPKQELVVFYEGRQQRKQFIPDFLVADQIVVEVKAASRIAAEHEAQLLNYMRITRTPVGYLVNFAPIFKLEWKRMILSEFAPSLPEQRIGFP